MSWAAVLALCACAYALKALGFALADRVEAETAQRWSLELVVVPLLAALILVQTFDGGERLVLDARAPALLVAGVLVWRRAPLLVVVLAAGATAALLRVAGV
jgi:branched-subunit amino acid transport protein